MIFSFLHNCHESQFVLANHLMFFIIIICVKIVFIVLCCFYIFIIYIRFFLFSILYLQRYIKFDKIKNYIEFILKLKRNWDILVFVNCLDIL